MGSSLRSFIKDIRVSKTLAEERSIIQKESAKIRTKLRDDHISLEKRRKNIQKLLYLFILGEKTHFGQVECINLIASDEFVDKRLGYLAAILLLDESQDLLTLLTNLLNNDLNHPNKYIVSLALNTLGFLTSSELARDLYPDVENILKASKDPFLLKKALQCTAKLIYKDVSLLDIFSIDYIKTIVENHTISTHGVLLGATKVLQSILLSYPKYLEILCEDGIDVDNASQRIIDDCVPLIPELISRLNNLNTKSSQPEFDVKSVCDPFLQCSIIYTLRLFFQLNNPKIDVYINKFEDLLTQIATNIDGSKSSGQAILYEFARTIFILKLDQPLRILGINILAKFLSGKDNNVRYVALNTLLQVVPQEPVAVQRHRKFISRCLHDPDVSIRMRALELTFAILDDNNIVELVEELIKFLEATTGIDKDLIGYTVEHLVRTFDIHLVTDERWKLEVFLKILKLVGSYITLEIISDILITINNTKDQKDKNYIVTEMLKISLNDDSEAQNQILDENVGWKLVTIWCIGEYADLVLSQNASSLINGESMTKYLTKLDSESGTIDNKIIHYVLTAALKLSSKIDNGRCIEDLRQIILNHAKDPNLMIQIKSVQFELIFSQPKDIKKSILESMPKFERKTKEAEVVKTQSQARKTQPIGNNDLLLDLLGDDDNIVLSKPDLITLPATQNDIKQTDLLADIFGSGNTITNQASTILDVQNSISIPSDATKVHESSLIDLYVKTTISEAGSAQIEMYIQAKVDIYALSCLCAVAKTQKLIMGALAPNNYIKDTAIAKQLLKISGTGKLKLRVKLNFTANNAVINEQFDYKFDQSL